MIDRVVGGDDSGPAHGAIGVGGEPRVDAGDVEGVAALGEQSERLIFLKLAEADGAVGPLDEAVAALVFHDRDRADHRLLQPDRADVPDGVVNNHIFFIDKIAAAVFFFGIAPRRRVGVGGVEFVDGVAGEEEEGGGEDDEGGGEGVGERGFVWSDEGRRRRRRWGLKGRLFAAFLASVDVLRVNTEGLAKPFIQQFPVKEGHHHY